MSSSPRDGDPRILFPFVLPHAMTKESDVDFWRQQVRTCSQHITRTSAPAHPASSPQAVASACVRLCPSEDILCPDWILAKLSFQFMQNGGRYDAGVSRNLKRGEVEDSSMIKPTTTHRKCTCNMHTKSRAHQASKHSRARHRYHFRYDYDIDEANSLPRPPSCRLIGAPFI
jgi:hypothetical protein